MSKQASITSVDDLETVIDTDFHVSESQSDILPYINAPFNKMLTRGESSDNLIGGSSFYPSAGFLTPMDTGKIKDEAVKSKDDALEGIDLTSADRVILSPGQNLMLNCVQHDDLGVALSRAYNEWLLDTLVDPNLGLFGSVIISHHKPEKAAEEIKDKADEPGIVGAMFPIGGIDSLLGDERFYPIYEACEEANLPLMLHNAASATIMDFPSQFRHSTRFITPHVAHHPAGYMFHLSSMLTHGVPERFSDLNIVVQESGLGWIPYFMRRYDNEYSEKREDAPLLKKSPSEYIRNQFYFTSQPVEGYDDIEYISNVIRHFDGEDSLMFSSDYPHFDFDHSSSLFETLKADFDDDTIANIYGRTALDVYDWP